jgi:hypothetical protein
MERVVRKGAAGSRPRGARRQLIGQISDRLFRDLEATVLAARGLLEPPAGRKERADSPSSEIRRHSSREPTGGTRPRGSGSAAKAQWRSNSCMSSSKDFRRLTIRPQTARTENWRERILPASGRTTGMNTSPELPSDAFLAEQDGVPQPISCATKRFPAGQVLCCVDEVRALV